MTPVEKGNTSFGEHPASLARVSQILAAVRPPATPVPALALPALMIRKRVFAAAKCPRADRNWSSAKLIARK